MINLIVLTRKAVLQHKAVLVQIILLLFLFSRLIIMASFDKAISAINMDESGNYFHIITFFNDYI